MNGEYADMYIILGEAHRSAAEAKWLCAERFQTMRQSYLMFLAVAWL
jgi:hypothetical protein